MITKLLSKKAIACLAITPMLFLSACRLPHDLKKTCEEILPSRTFDKIPKPKPIITKDLQKKKLPIQESKNYLQDEIRLLWPCQGKVVRKFGENNEEGRPSHGIHILGSSHAPVRASMDGTVIYSGSNRKFVNVVIIRKGKIKIAYGYLEEGLPRAGSQVSAGQTIGTLSDKRPILYMAVQIGTLSVDPVEYME